MPDWLTWLAAGSLLLGGTCATAVAVDLIWRPQRMGIMNLVWPITALYGGPLAVWLYGRAGRAPRSPAASMSHTHGHEHRRDQPFWLTAAAATTHCGSGCALGDICAEWLMFFYPWTLLGRKMFGAWVVDYFFALAFGVAFQYFTIAPMRNLSLGQGLAAALKADTLSLSAWQIGMYGWMAIAVLGIFGEELSPTSPVFWFMMQIAMTAGFVTSYPVNWWLLKAGIKEPM